MQQSAPDLLHLAVQKADNLRQVADQARSSYTTSLY
ncbi:hypothetical protein [Caudoviricetes sp.]|nr:hypothetical protein [Caudoviricetes sp.]